MDMSRTDRAKLILRVSNKESFVIFMISIQYDWPLWNLNLMFHSHVCFISIIHTFKSASISVYVYTILQTLIAFLS